MRVSAAQSLVGEVPQYSWVDCAVVRTSTARFSVAYAPFHPGAHCKSCERRRARARGPVKRRSSLVHPCRINRNAKDAFPGSHQCRFYAPALRVVEPRRADNSYDVDHASANPARGRTSPGRATPSMRPSSWFRGPRRRSPLQVSRPWCRNCTEGAAHSYSPGR
jgi:hypothetical protein